MSENAVYRATGVALGVPGARRGLLIEGAPGAGKSSLALALIDRGAALIGDDAVTLSLRGERVWSAPPPNTAGLIEIRNVGIVTLDTADAAVCLMLRLDPEAPRHVDEPGTAELLGRRVPLLRLRPDVWPLPLRAEWALARYGLS